MSGQQGSGQRSAGGQRGTGPLPILVLGIARNGTTWLGNIFAAAEGVAAAEHPLHHGIHESNILKQSRYWGRLDETDAYIRFLHLYASEDYFSLAGGRMETFLGMRFESFYHFFCELMDRYADKTGGRFWTTKLDPLFYIYPRELDEFLALLERRYGQAKFVAVRREIEPAIASYLDMEGDAHGLRKRGPFAYLSILLGVLRYANAYRRIGRIVDERGGIMLRFEELTGDMSSALAKIAAYTGLPQEAFGESPYSPNTSFSGSGSGADGVSADGFPAKAPSSRPDREVKRRLSAGERLFVHLAYAFARLLPFFPPLLLRLYESLKPKKPPLFHRLIKREHYPEQLKEELRKKGSVNLVGRVDEG